LKQKLQSYFVWSLWAAIIFQILLGIGVGSLLVKRLGFPELLVDSLPWIALAVMAICAALLLFGAMQEGKTGSNNRLMHHVVGWTIAGAVILLLRYGGDWILELFPRDVSNPILNYLSRFFHAFIGVFVSFAEGYGLFAGLMCFVFALAILAVGWAYSINDRPEQIERLFVGNIVAKIAAIPMVLTALGIFVGATLWTVAYSFTKSGLLPKFEIDKLTLDQYSRLWGEPRWIQSIINLAIYGICSLIFTMVIGFLLAAMLDRKIRFENTFRTIFLYPFALSFIVTGLVWQWILNPEYGIQSLVRKIGFESFTFDPLYNPDIVVFGLLIAGLWQGTGLVMCIMLAGLRGIDEDIWKAARVDGIPMWKTYTHIVIPMMKPVFITALVLITSGIVRLYDLVVAQTSGGPGIASEVPAKYVYDKMFLGQNLGQGFAASTMMLLTVVIVLIPWAYLQFGGRKNG
jgi:glucose/mannose transport system permease protein